MLVRESGRSCIKGRGPRISREECQKWRDRGGNGLPDTSEAAKNVGGFVLASSTKVKGYAHIKFNGREGVKLSQYLAERFAGHNQPLSPQIIANLAIAGICRGEF